MSFISPYHLARMQQIAARSFDTDATVMRPSAATYTAGGGQSATPAALPDPVRGRLRSVKEPRVIAEEGGKTSAVTVWEFVCAPGSDIRPTDTLRIDGDSYSIVETDAGRSDPLVLVVTVRRTRAKK